MTKANGNRSLELTGARAILHALRHQHLTMPVENGVQLRPARHFHSALLETLDEINTLQPQVADWWADDSQP